MFKNIISKNHIVFALVLFCIVSALTIIPFLTQPGVIGHTLDWSIPENYENFLAMRQQALYIWNDIYNLGFDMANGQVTAWCWYLISMLSINLGLSGAVISKIIVFLGTLAPALSMYLTARYFLKRLVPAKNTWATTLAALVAGFFYGYSPIVFNQLVGGAFLHCISYTAMPLTLWFFAASLSEKGRFKWAYVIAGGISFSAACIANQFAIWLLIMLVGYIVVVAKYKKRYFFSLLLIIGQTILLNIYWLLPVIKNFSITIASLSTIKDAPTSFTDLITHGIPFAEVLNSIGFWNPYFIESLPGGFNIIWYVAAAVLIICAVSVILIQRKNRFIWYLVLIVLISAFFAKGGLAPFGSLNIDLYKYFPVFFIFRTLHHFLILPAFGIALLLSYRLYYTFSKPGGNQKSFSFFAVLGSVIIVTVLYLFPFMLGSLNKNVGTFSSSEELQATLKTIETPEAEYRLVYFPIANSPKYPCAKSNCSSSGGDPNMIYSPTPTFFTDIGVDSAGKSFVRDAALALYNDYPTAWQFFSLLNSKYFVFLKDRKPAHYERELAFFGKENYQSLLQSGLEKRLGEPLKDSSNLSYWKYDETLPLIYASNQVVEINDQPSSLLNLLNLNQLKDIDNPTFLFSGNVGDDQLMPAAKIDSIYVNSFDSNYITHAENWEMSSIYAQSNKISNSIEYEFSAPAEGNYPFDMAYSCEDRTIKLEIALDDKPVEVLNCEADSFDQFNLKSLGETYLSAGTHQLKISEVNKVKSAGSFHVYYYNFYKIVDTVSADNFGALPQISFEKINPTHFQVHINAADSPFYLNFLESYHPGWQATVDGQLLDRHQIVNSYANAWLVDKKGDYTIEINYQPQQLYARASLISLIFLGILSAALLVCIIREKYGLVQKS